MAPYGDEEDGSLWQVEGAWDLGYSDTMENDTIALDTKTAVGPFIPFTRLIARH